MYDKSTADVAFMEGDYETAAQMYLDGARDGDATASFNYGYCLINGLGAPRAFYTPVLKAIKVPNTSYGEDYALGLRFSREYQIGRIYDVLYNCRRWKDNSDASLDIVKMNNHNLYKDRIRTWELQARVALKK